MKHTPYGYKIVGGKAVVDEEEADNIRQIAENYLSGMSFTASASAVGVSMQHSRVKRLLQNSRYLGDDFYPAILSDDLMGAVEEERKRRDAEYKGTRYRKKTEERIIPVAFRMKKPDKAIKSPIENAEYLYSLIESKVK